MNDLQMRSNSSLAAFPCEETEQSIPDRFEKQVALFASRPALNYKGQRTTYGALNAAANAIARSILAERDEGTERVALLFEHGVSALEAMLGVLKAGKAYVPLDPSLPVSRTAYILDDSGANLILTNERNRLLAQRLTRGRSPVISTDDLEPPGSQGNLGLTIAPDAIAYILYTSGSNGRPKGVVQNHRNLLHFIRSFTTSLGILHDDRLALLFSLSFSASNMSVYGALLTGASVHPYDIKGEGLAYLADWLIREEITVYHSIPRVLQQFMDGLNGAERFPRLRVINVGGEPLARIDVDRFRSHFAPPCILVNHFACTEASVIAQYFINHETPVAGTHVPVGRDADGVEVLLLDEEGHKVDCDRIGEIGIQSRYLSPAYWQRPDLDAAAFTPGSPNSDVKIFRTGDLGRRRPDGLLEHMGRKDFRVKIRGHSIEIAEIEIALRNQAEIKDAVVLANEDQLGQKRLVAYIVPAQGRTLTVGSLRISLARVLPEYMIPAVFVMREALPLTSNGKIDRRALLPPEATRPVLDNAFVAPRNLLEERLAQLWHEVLGVARPGVHDNFFELGGDSLLAVRLFLAIEKHLGKCLPIALLLQAPTIAQLAAVLGQHRCSLAKTSLIGIQTKGSRPPLFCVHGGGSQILIYRPLAAHLGPDQPVYALQPQGLDGDLNRVEDMAARYLQEIRAVQDQGPYYLGGFSMGGLVAYEMAQQLRAQGEEVGLVALFDTFCGRNHPDGPPEADLGVIGKVGYRFRCFLQRVHLHVSAGALLRPEERLNFFWNKAQLRGRLHKLASKYKEGERLDISENVHGGYSLWQAGGAYKPRAYSGRVVLFRCRLQPPLGLLRRDPTLGWSSLVTSAWEIIDVAGSHAYLFREPFVRNLAAKLGECLRKFHFTLPSP